MQYPDYNPSVATDPLSDAELDELAELLEVLPSDGVMSLEGLDGFVTGLLVGPGLARTLKGSQWLPLVWGGDGAQEPAPFESNRQRKKLVVQVLRHLRSLDVVLNQDPQAWQPVVSVAEEEGTAEGEGEEWVDATEWCTGFLQAMDLDRDAWTPWLDSDLAPQFVPLLLLAGLPEERPAGVSADLESVVVRDELSRAFLDTVQALVGQPPQAH